MAPTLPPPDDGAGEGNSWFDIPFPGSGQEEEVEEQEVKGKDDGSKHAEQQGLEGIAECDDSDDASSTLLGVVLDETGDHAAIPLESSEGDQTSASVAAATCRGGEIKTRFPNYNHYVLGFPNQSKHHLDNEKGDGIFLDFFRGVSRKDADFRNRHLVAEGDKKIGKILRYIVPAYTCLQAANFRIWVRLIKGKVLGKADFETTVFRDISQELHLFKDKTASPLRTAVKKLRAELKQEYGKPAALIVRPQDTKVPARSSTETSILRHEIDEFFATREYDNISPSANDYTVVSPLANNNSTAISVGEQHRLPSPADNNATILYSGTDNGTDVLPWANNNDNTVSPSVNKNNVAVAPSANNNMVPPYNNTVAPSGNDNVLSPNNNVAAAPSANNNIMISPSKNVAVAPSANSNTTVSLKSSLPSFSSPKPPQNYFAPTAGQTMPLEYTTGEVNVHRHDSLLDICRQGSPDLNSLRASLNAHDPNARDASGNCALHLLCNNEFIVDPQLFFQCVDIITTNWPDYVHITNQDGMLPLHVAARQGAPLAVIRRLVSAWPDSVKAQDAIGSIPLHVAATSQASFEVIQELDPSALVLNSLRWSPLHSLCATYRPTTPAGADNFIKTVQYLVLRQPHALHCADRRKGDLPIHLACDRGAPLASIKLLAGSTESQRTVILQTENLSQQVALHKACAAYAPSRDTLTYLAKAWAPSTMAQDVNGQTPFCILADCLLSEPRRRRRRQRVG